MSEAEQVKFHIKVVINREKTKVLFAEAGSDFTDVLLCFLLLPLGTIMEVLEKHYGDKAPVVGSLNTLYRGASNLDVVHFHGEVFKKYVVNSTHFESELCKLRLNIRGTQPTSPTCSESYEGVFTDGAASFIITDDLCVLPNGTGSIIETLSTLGVAVKDMDGVDIRNVTFGLNEIIALLKESLISSNPLTALIFPARKMIVATEGHVLLHQIDQRPTLVIPENMMLKVMLQKSTNKFLFAQADCDFVNFLFVMLIISLGRVEWFLGSSTGLKSMDNLHRSVADNSNSMHLKDSDTKDLLIRPKHPNCYLFNGNRLCLMNLDQIGNQSYVHGPRMYMVRDDLTVAPLGVTLGLSIFNELKISLSDVKEVEVQVGLEEGLSILKAALTSTTALTDGLINPFLNKQPQFKTTFIATLPPPCSATIVKQRFLNIFITTNCKFSMSEAEQVKFHIKFVINKEKTKVLFAEAGSDFTDMLLSFLLLPLGKIVQVLEEHYADKAPVIGSLTTLYKGASDLDVIHFLGDAIKKNLISSTHFESDEICELRLNICGAQPTRSSSEESCFSSGESYNGVFIKSTACCIISDDLRVLPNVSGSIIETLSTLGIAVEDMDGTETRNMTFGLNEIIALLKESLISMNPLTALIFPGRQMTLATDRHAFLNQIDEYVILRNTKRMILKVMLQKSTNMLLFAQADCDFVNFLFKNLTTSLGRVEWFLGSDTGLKSIDNLHRSVADDSNKIRVKDSYTKDLLIQPKPTDHIYSCSEYEYCFLNFSHHISSAYVDGVIMYMVSDDLTVAPLGVTSGLSIINELKISLSDIKEVELQVGLEEGLSILKAALTSTTALTDGLIKPFLEKQEREQQLESKS